MPSFIRALLRLVMPSAFSSAICQLARFVVARRTWLLSFLEPSFGDGQEEGTLQIVLLAMCADWLLIPVFGFNLSKDIATNLLCSLRSAYFLFDGSMRSASTHTSITCSARFSPLLLILIILHWARLFILFPLLLASFLLWLFVGFSVISFWRGPALYTGGCI